MRELRRDLQVCGKKYHLWREEEYIGIATWMEFLSIGEVFLRETNEGFEVCLPDEWELIKDLV